MFPDLEEEAAYSVHARNLSPPRKARPSYSPRYDRRRPQAGQCNGAHRRRLKRNAL